MSPLLLVGDLHDNTAHAIAALDKATREGCDKVFAVGDFGAWEHKPDGVEYFDDIDRHAHERGITVYFLDGNHDKTSLVVQMYGNQPDDEGFLTCRPNLRYAPRGHRWTWDGKSFIALGGAYSVDKAWRLARENHYRMPPGTLWFPEEEMTDQEMDRILLTGLNALAPDPAFGTLDIMLTHDKPRASKPGWNRKDLPQCWPNQDRIQRAVEALKPTLLVHGHLHYRYEDTICYNDGAVEDWTKVIGLDCDHDNADSADPEDSWLVLDLAAPLDTGEPRD